MIDVNNYPAGVIAQLIRHPEMLLKTCYEFELSRTNNPAIARKNAVQLHDEARKQLLEIAADISDALK